MPAPSSESAGIRAAIRALRQDGWTLDYVYDGGERVPVRTEREAMAAILAVGDAWLYVKRDAEIGQGSVGWVRFVM